MIVVTGATGQFGQQAITSLLERGAAPGQVLALTRNEASAAAFREKGIGVAIGDYDNRDSLVRAFRGADKLLFVSGNDLARRLEQHQHVVEAAKEAGVRHVVYTSVQRKTDNSSSPLWPVLESHLQTETWLKESGLGYTILRNNLYMDLIPAFTGEHVLQTGQIYLPAGNGNVAAVLRAELAEAAAAVLLGQGHENRVYNFSNGVSFSYHDVADAIHSITGKEISYTSPTAGEYVDTLRKYQVPEEYIGVFSGFAVAQDQGELEDTASTLEELLGRKPTDIRSFLSAVYA